MRKRPYWNTIGLFAALVVFGCQSAAPLRTGPTSTLEAALYAEIDRTRAANGLRPWIRSDALADLARAHSARMAAGTTGFDHSGFDARAESAMDATGDYRAAENLARTKKSAGEVADAAVRTWLADRPHRKNLLGDFLSAGVGIAQSASGEYFATLLVTGK